jgi:hypothetical protein
MRFAFP